MMAGGSSPLKTFQRVRGLLLLEGGSDECALMGAPEPYAYRKTDRYAVIQRYRIAYYFRAVSDECH